MPRKTRLAQGLKVVNPDCVGIGIGKDRHFVAVDPARSAPPPADVIVRQALRTRGNHKPGLVIPILACLSLVLGPVHRGCPRSGTNGGVPPARGR